MYFKKIFLVACLLFPLLILFHCKHEVQSAHEKILKDKSLSDASALPKIAQAAFVYTFQKKHKPFRAVKNPSGGFTLVGYVLDTSKVTSLNQKNFGKIEKRIDAKTLWRIFRGGASRNLSQIIFSRRITLIDGKVIELYRVRISLNDLKKINGWNTADPYSVGEHDVLDTAEAKKVVQEITTSWTVMVDNTSRIRIR